MLRRSRAGYRGVGLGSLLALLLAGTAQAQTVGPSSTLAAANITGGTINGATIGLKTPAAAAFTTLTSAATGIYTNTQMNDLATALLNGLSTTTEYHGQFSGYATEALVGGIAVPVGSAVLQANGVAGYVNNLSTTTNAVGGFFSARALAASTNNWAMNAIVFDGGFASTNAILELDANMGSTGSSVAGLLLHGASSATPAASWGILIDDLGSSVKWGAGIEIGAGSSTIGEYIGATAASGNSLNSMPLEFEATSSGGSPAVTTLQGTPTGLENVGAFGIGIAPPAGVELFVHAASGINLSVTSNGANLYSAAVVDANNSLVGWEQNASFFQFDGQVVLPGYAVASLPSGNTGGLAYVTDQATSCPVFGGTFTGSGSVKCLAFYNGSAWVGG